MNGSKRKKDDEDGKERPPKKKAAQPLHNSQAAASFFAPRVEGTTRIATWNLAGIRSASGEKRDFAFRKYVEAEDCDILVITEVRYQQIKNAEEFEWLARRYKHRYWSEPDVLLGVVSKFKPMAPAVFGFPSWAESHHSNASSRCATVEFKEYFLVGTYVRNSGTDGKNLKERRIWNRDFRKYIKELQKAKPVVWCGDFNVLPERKDIERASRVWDKVAGAFPEERADHELLMKECDLVDVWRLMNPEGREYTQSNNHTFGLRLDYFIVSRSFLTRVKSSTIQHAVRDAFPGASDHWPVECVLEGTPDQQSLS
ncbi:DNase I-like protein [Meredithblackwellia eburnea MCA 4105]